MQKKTGRKRSSKTAEKTAGGRSKGTEKLLKQIEQVIVRSGHPSVEYLVGGAVRENSRNYDLTTREGREEYQKKCRETIGGLIMFDAATGRERENDLTPRRFILETGKLEPWLTLGVLIGELAYQMETQDLVDRFLD